MKSEKPICSCGEELVYYKTKTTEYWYEINDKGKINKNPKRTYDTTVSSNDEFLECSKCGNRYAVHFDNDGRLTRDTEIW
jgi:hypothetical protein